MGEVDGAFILPPEHKPNSEIIEVGNIPLIDLSPLESSNANDLPSLVAEIRDACANWGFFQVINQGVALTCRERIEIALKKFFALTKEEKKKVSRDASEEYAAEMEKLAFKLLELISLSLLLPKDRLNGYCKDQTSRIILNHYPPCPVPHLTLGVGRHKDAGVFTIHAQDDVGGLEVKSKRDGQWVFIKLILNAYIGDVTQIWSNEKYESVEHRAMVYSEKERFSIPCFFHPAHYT